MRVLFLTHRLPYAPNRGDRLRAYHMLRAMREGASVDLVSLAHDRVEAAHASDLDALADSVTVLRVSRVHQALRAARALLTARPLTHALLDAPGSHRRLRALVGARRPDVVLAYCSSMARFAFEAPLAGLPLVVDLMDVDSGKWRSLSAAARWPRSVVYAREARLLARFESVIARGAAATLVVNARERNALASVDPSARAIVVENGVDVAHFTRDHLQPRRPTVVFSGVMNYAPNAQGAVWIAREVWPLVRARRTDARLVLVGAEPGDEVKGLARRDPSITVTGTVPSVREYLWEASVAVAPLRIAHGVKNKVVEAVAAGLPCVTTPAVDAGVPVEARPACLVRDTPATFADAIVGLLERSPAERATIAARANVSALDWAVKMRALMPILEAAAARRPVGTAGSETP